MPSRAGDLPLSPPALDDDVGHLVAEMTVEEKADLLTGASGWTTVGVPRLGVKSVFVADGPHGVRRALDSGSFDTLIAQPATCFPTASLLASSWDVEMVRSVGAAIGDEARALGVDVVLGPGVNIKRSPLCGRNFEYFSEDPYLSGEMAVAHIDGVQSRGVGASVKHFAVNNQETRRFSVDAQVDERTLREIYLPAFEAAVRRARPWTVMCSYNRINGVLGTEQRYLITDILRGEWGFDGLTMSDWGAVRDRVAAVAAGLDLEMPGPRRHRTQRVLDAVKRGDLALDLVDAAVARVVELSMRTADRGDRPARLEADAHHRLARDAAAAGMVLLKNDGLLPLRGASRIAVVGRSARDPHYQGTGSSHITPTRLDVPFDEVALMAGDAVLTFAEGYSDTPELRPDLVKEAAAVAADADVAVLFATVPPWKEIEGADRDDIDLPEQQVALIKAVAAVQPRLVVVLNNGSAVAMAEWIEPVAAVLEAWMMGQAGGGAVADILFGRVNPSGKLAETFPRRLEDTPSFSNFPGERDVARYGEGLFVGYRWYDARDIDPQFPFGHGLSYTKFEYSGVRASRAEIESSEGVEVSLDVKNTGDRAGQEVVQVYVRPPRSSVLRAGRELRGFAKVSLDTGETKTVAIQIEPRAFAFYDVVAAEWVTLAGEYELLVGASSRDIRGKATVRIAEGSPRKSTLARHSLLSDWLDHPLGRPIAEDLLGRLKPALARSLGSEPDMPDEPAALTMVFLRSMPVPTVVEFAMDPDSPYGDDVADAMLERLSAQVSGRDPLIPELTDGYRTP
jgi:beta-glucosidase